MTDEKRVRERKSLLLITATIQIIAAIGLEAVGASFAAFVFFVMSVLCFSAVIYPETEDEKDENEKR